MPTYSCETCRNLIFHTYICCSKTIAHGTCMLGLALLFCAHLLHLQLNIRAIVISILIQSVYLALWFFIAHWHHDADNKLHWGTLFKGAYKCKMTYDIYVPHNLYDCLKVLIISHNSHNHPPPLSIKTPPQIVNYIKSLLLWLNWKLANATSQWLALDSGFIQSL